eukprot:1155093-Pelagomonas_calceolata.AAC.2
MQVTDERLCITNAFYETACMSCRFLCRIECFDCNEGFERALKDQGINCRTEMGLVLENFNFPSHQVRLLIDTNIMTIKAVIQFF